MGARSSFHSWSAFWSTSPARRTRHRKTSRTSRSSCSCNIRATPDPEPHRPDLEWTSSCRQASAAVPTSRLRSGFRSCRARVRRVASSEDPDSSWSTGFRCSPSSTGKSVPSRKPAKRSSRCSRVRRDQLPVQKFVLLPTNWLCL